MIKRIETVKLYWARSIFRKFLLSFSLGGHTVVPEIWILLSIFILFFAGLFHPVASGFRNSSSDSNLNIVSPKNNFDSYRTESYLLNAENIVRKTLGEPSTGKCTIHLRHGSQFKVKATANNVFNIDLAYDYSSLTRNKTTSRDLLKVFILFSLNLPYSEKNIQSVTWLADAFNRKLNRTIKQNPYPIKGDFPGLHHLIMSHYKLKTETILNHSIPPTNKIAYEFNSEVCEALLNAILSLKNGKKFLREYLTKACLTNSSNSIDLFYEILAKNLSLTKEKCKKLFAKHLNETAFKLSANSYMPPSVKYVTDVFRTICNVSYQPKLNPNTKKQCPLEDLPEIWNDINSPEHLIKKLSLEFSQLKNYSPYLMQKPIDKIIKVIPLLRNEESRKIFRANILICKQNFEDAANKQLNLQKLLWDEEVKNVKVPLRYDRYLQVINSDEKYLKDLFPELDSYLTKEFQITQ